MHYPNGIRISVDPPNALTWTRTSTNYFSFWPTSSADPRVPVTITMANG